MYPKIRFKSAMTLNVFVWIHHFSILLTEKKYNCFHYTHLTKNYKSSSINFIKFLNQFHNRMFLS